MNQQAVTREREHHSSRDWTIGRRLGLGFGALGAIVVILATLGFYNARRLATFSLDAERAASGNLFVVERKVDHLTWVNALERHLLDGTDFKGQLDPAKCAFGAWRDGEGAQDAARDASLARLLKDIERPHERLHHSAQAILESGGQHNPEEAKRVFVTETLPALEGVTAVMGRIKDHYATANAAANSALKRSASSTQMLLAVLGLVSLLTTVAIAIVTRNSLVARLRAVVSDLSDGSGQVHAASAQVAGASQSLSQGATEQAAALEETSASMEEMASMTRKNAENSQEAAVQVAETQKLVGQANSSLQHLVTSMSAIRESSARVTKIVKTIDEIAFQTNILALNAAVEAARAGEAGMGFAVVADEVRNLAQRSAQAAKDTAALIEESASSALAGVAKVDVVVGAMGAITDSSSRVKGLIDEVSVASREQAQGIDQVTQAITQMEKVTQTTAATAEESAAASEELNAQAEQSLSVVARLDALVGGAGRVATHMATSHPPARRPAGTKVVKMTPVASPVRPTSAEQQIPFGDTGTFGRF